MWIGNDLEMSGMLWSTSFWIAKERSLLLPAKVHICEWKWASFLIFPLVSERKKARFHTRHNPNQPFRKTQLPASFRLAWRLCVWKCSWTNSCFRSYEYTSCEIFACNSLFKLNAVQRVKMYFCFFAKRIIIRWSSFSVMPINISSLCL